MHFSMKDYTEITLALAGVCQAAKLVQQFATQGVADEKALHISLESLLQFNPPNTLAVYGGDLANLRLGLNTLCEQLNATQKDVGSYWLSLIALEGKLRKSDQARAELNSRMQRLPQQLVHYALESQQMCNILASIYVDVISPLGSKIKVYGNVDFLNSTSIPPLIRACLLAGMRSAVLWRQVGGTKWQLLFSRKKILHTAQHLLHSI